jgi:hypothetical protein
MVSCEKNEIAIPNQSLGHFLSKTTSTYYVQNTANSVFNVTVGTTTISDKDRVLNYTVTSPTGAAPGVQYSIANSGTVTIPAGQATANIPVKGLFAGYPTGRIDTLKFKLTSGDELTPADYNNEFTLVLKKYCEVDLKTFKGDYLNTSNSATGAKYKTTVDTAVSTGPTSGYIMVRGLFNGTSSPVRVNLDWSDPANFTTTVVQTSGIYIDQSANNYGPVSVRPIGTGTFSSCDNTFTLSYQRFVSAGNFTANMTTMAR